MPGQSLFIQGMTLADARLAHSGVLATNSTDPGDIRQGVLFTGQRVLVGATSGLNVTVLPFHFAASKAYSNGAYLGFNPIVATVPVPAAPPLGLKRIDVLYVVQQDPGALVSPDPTGVNACVFGVHPGVVSSTPSKPALTDSPSAPAGSIEVGTIAWDSTSGVPTATNASGTGASCTITTTCQWTASRGAPIPVNSQTERDSTLTFSDGMKVLRLDLGITEVSFNSTWRSTGPYAQATGSVAVTTTSGTPNVAQTITLPAGLFTLPPNIQVTWSSASGFVPMMRTYSVTASSFGLNVISAPSDIGPVSGTVFWVATQANAANA